MQGEIAFLELSPYSRQGAEVVELREYVRADGIRQRVFAASHETAAVEGGSRTIELDA